MIEFQGVQKAYGTKIVLDCPKFHVDPGQFTVLIGRSGSGKSTLLKMINRLIVPTRGKVLVNGEDIAPLHVGALRQRIGYAIQGTGLFPHWTVGRNIGTVPWLKGWSKDRIKTRVCELLSLVQLDPDIFYNKYPTALSGGQAQRVGVARALAVKPDILLMDEPFGALDPLTREQLQEDLLRIQAHLKTTVIFVTHDLDEALKLAQKLAIMDSGKIIQYDAPHKILAHPNSDFVADFLGRPERGLRYLTKLTATDFLKKAVTIPSPGQTVQDVRPDTPLWTIDEKGRPHQVRVNGQTRPLKSEDCAFEETPARQLLSQMIWQSVSEVGIVDQTGRLIGYVPLENLITRHHFMEKRGA